MIPSGFDYAAPASLDKALSLLSQGGDDAKILAGGHSLLPLIKLRLATPSLLVDLARVPDLSYIRDAGDSLAIGAMTPYAELETSDLVRRRIPVLAEVTSMIGDPQVRNRGTLGGAIAHADPAGDMPSLIMALGGAVVASGSQGERTIDIADFFQDVFTSALAPDEIVTEIRVRAQDGVAASYQKFRRRAIDWAVVGVAVAATRSNGSIDSASVVLTNVGSTPTRAAAVEEALRGQPATADTIRAASELADQGLDPSGDLFAPPDYKKHLARVLTRRALGEALAV